MRAFLLALYRWVQKKVVGPQVAQRRFGETINNPPLGTLGVEGRSGVLKDQSSAKASGEKFWFHAASVGELEALWPLIRLAATHSKSLVVTVFSPSAESSLKKLVQELATLPDQNFSLDWGYSPWEGDWREALSWHRPALFISHKYEAWPDLWLSLTELNIPLVIVGSSFRPSLKTAKKFCLTLLKRLPRLQLLPFNQSQASQLASCFPAAQISVIQDPRWERVLGRARTGNSRSAELVQTYANQGQIRGIIGSAWMEDLRFLEPVLAEIEGPIWIVPHKIDEDSVAEIETFLRGHGFAPIRTQSNTKNAATKNSNVTADGPSSNTKGKEFILVNELGVLAELYGVAEWVFVGGGFGSGVHSTIEPAIHGLPIAIGPNGAHKFYEIEEMTATGQVTVLSKQSDLREWVRRLQGRDFLPFRNIWREQALGHSGAAQKIFEAVENFK